MSASTRNRPLRRQVYDTVREDLRQGRIGKETLLVERELASELGVSRTPVREALYALEQDGFVQSTARGFKPRRLNDMEITHVFEMRQLLEPHALASVVDAEAAALERDLVKALDAQRRAHEEDDAEAFMAGNEQYRSAWLDRLTNPRLASAIALYDDHIHALRLSTLHDGDTRRVAIQSLQAVVEAVASGKRDRVISRYKAHLRAAEKALRVSQAE
ncbi:MAG: GntR family transcriptional regulator [Pseudomonadota bacterium]